MPKILKQKVYEYHELSHGARFASRLLSKNIREFRKTCKPWYTLDEAEQVKHIMDNEYYFWADGTIWLPHPSNDEQLEDNTL